MRQRFNLTYNSFFIYILAVPYLPAPLLTLALHSFPACGFQPVFFKSPFSALFYVPFIFIGPLISFSKPPGLFVASGFLVLFCLNAFPWAPLRSVSYLCCSLVTIFSLPSRKILLASKRLAINLLHLDYTTGSFGR